MASTSNAGTWEVTRLDRRIWFKVTALRFVVYSPLLVSSAALVTERQIRKIKYNQ
jgi:hypothetical protein